MSMYRPGRPVQYDPVTGVGHKPPAKPGEYRLLNAAGKPAYIGTTCNLSRRISEHSRNGKIPAGGRVVFQVADGRSTSRTRAGHERSKIKQHSPYLNKSKGGEGRPAGR